jgi:Tfp pilus assembly protein PilO
MSEKKTALWRERLASPLTWHYAGFAVLLVAVIVLGTRFGLDWAALSGRSSNEITDKKVQLKALDMQTAPMRGLDKRLAETRDAIKDFYTDRIPASYSSISGEIGELAVKSGVRMTRVQYTQRLPSNNLSEIDLDSGITGSYPEIMKFINSLEREKIFFEIRGMNLTGQQGGLVNLRLQVATWLRPADAAASGLPQTEERPESSEGGKEGEAK